MSSIFAQMIRGEVFVDKVYESKALLVIKDRDPKAPVHLLLIPKKGYLNLQEIPKEELGIIQEIVCVAQDLAKQLGIENGYRLLTNVGVDGGQSVFHLHFHLIGGKPLGSFA